MRRRDVIGTAAASLGRQKARTALTLLGVAVGAAVLVVSLSVGTGLRRAVRGQFDRDPRLREIRVMTGYGDTGTDGVPAGELRVEGDMSGAKRERIRKVLARRWRMAAGRHSGKTLRKADLDVIAGLPHVEAVAEFIREGGRARLAGDWHRVHSMYGVPPDAEGVTERLVAGRGFSGPRAGEAVVHEFLLYLWGVRDDDDVANVVGRTFTLQVSNARDTSPLQLLKMFNADESTLSLQELRVLNRAREALPAALDKLDMSAADLRTLRAMLSRTKSESQEADAAVTAKLKIVGVVRAASKEEEMKPDVRYGFMTLHSEILLPLGTARRLFGGLPRRRRRGVEYAIVRADSRDAVAGVERPIKGMGFRTYSLAEFLRQVNTNVRLVGFTMNFIALIALFVAALGIANTLLTSVIERTREIGVMKAVGARDGHILGMFLCEGAAIGLIGGVIGVLAGYLASLPADEYARQLFARQTQKPFDGSLFAYPWWLPAGVPAFTTAVTTLAAWLPARRASRVRPVVALRHE